MSVGKSSISRISKKESAPATEEVKPEVIAEVKPEAAEVKAPAKKTAPKASTPKATATKSTAPKATATKSTATKSATKKAPAKKPAAPKATTVKPAAPKKAENGFKIYQVSDELPYYLL